MVETIRDVAIILLALLNIALITVLIVIALQVWKLVRIIAKEVPELTERAKDTATTVQGTTDFLGSTIAKPLIQLASFFAGVNRFFSTLVGGSRKTVVTGRRPVVTVVTTTEEVKR